MLLIKPDRVVHPYGFNWKDDTLVGSGQTKLDIFVCRSFKDLETSDAFA